MCGVALVVALSGISAVAVEAHGADRPELTAAIISVGGASAPTAQTVPLWVEVRNLGTADSAQTSVRFYRSTDSKITTADTLVTVERLRPVSGGYTQSVMGQVKVGTTPGKFWFGACVVPVPDELDAGNDCTSGAAIEVGKRPEVVAADFEVSPTSVAPGASMHFAATIRNDGTGTAAPGYAQVFHSPDPVITGNDEPVVYNYLQTPALAPGASFAVSVSANERFGSGTSWYGVCASNALFESSASDNCTTGVQVTVDGPDLAALAPSLDHDQGDVGDAVTLTVEARNVGNAPSSPTTIYFTFQGPSQGGPFATLPVPTLAPGASQLLSASKVVDTPGSTDLWACIDVADDELGQNNCSTAATFRVSGVELEPEQGWIRVGESNYAAGFGFTAGTVVMMYVAGPSGVTAYGPYVPDSIHDYALYFTPPVTVSLGNGFASLVAINTDQGYAASAPACVNVVGPQYGNPPSIREIDGVELAKADCTVPFAYVRTALSPGQPFVVDGNGFDDPRASLFTGAGNLGPLPAASGGSVLEATFATPDATPVGTASVQVVSAPYTGNASSNAVLVFVGEPISIDSVSVNGATVTVAGHGFAPGAVVNLFNAHGGSVVNLGGLDSGGAPLVPLASVTPTGFQFQRPAGAVSGKAYVQVLNPPFIPVTSTGNDPDGAFDFP